MKKLIQICSLLSLVFVLSAISVNAQSQFGSEVEIPFSFSVGDRSYEAGTYIVKLNKIQNGAAAVIISDPRTDSVQTVLASRNGDNADEKVKLVFDRHDGETVLSRVITPSGGFALRLTQQQRNVAERNRTPRGDGIGVGGHF